jgi:hypothetical protein
MSDILARAGVKIIEADHLMPLCQEGFAQVRSDESGAAGYKYLFDSHGRVI